MPASRSLPLLARIAARPGRALAAFLGLHAAVWTALPTLLYPNLPLDLIEALIYGREWQLGYDKLPPLPWWLVEIVYRLVGHDFAYYLLAQAAADGVVQRHAGERGQRHDRRGAPIELEGEIEHGAERASDKHHADRNEDGADTTHAVNPGRPPPGFRNPPADMIRAAGHQCP